MDRKISELFDSEFEIQTEDQSNLFPPRAIQKRTFQKLHPHTHAVRGSRRTLILAAACMVLLLATASAVGISLFHQRQAQLRQTLQAEPSEPVYQEFAETDGTQTIQLLSAVSNADFTFVYLSVSPVTAEEAEAGAADRFWFSTDGLSWSSADILDDYDEASQSVTLLCAVLRSKETNTLYLRRYDVDGNQITSSVRDFGKVKLTIEAPEVKTIPVNIPLTNPSTGETGILRSLEIYPVGINWVFSLPDGEEGYLTWADTLRSVADSTVIKRADGVTIHGDQIVAEHWPAQGDQLTLIGIWKSPVIDPTQLEQITVLGQTIPVSP